MNDPFASAPDEPQTAVEETTTEPRTVGTVKVAVKPDFQGFDGGKVVLTFKGGSGFDAPWIVIHATDLQDAHDQITGSSAELLAEIMYRAQKAGQHFSGLGPAKASGASIANVNVNSAPQGATEPPAGTRPAPGPDWVYKTGFNEAKGKAWKAWMPPRGSNESPVWL